MDKPEKLILDDGLNFRLGYNGALVGIGVMVLGGGLAMIQSDATLADLVLPMGTLSAFWLFWVTVNGFIGLIHRFVAKRDIDRFFDMGIWQYWRFSSSEWQDIVEAEYNKMRPEEGAGAYPGAIYSPIFGMAVIF